MKYPVFNWKALASLSRAFPVFLLWGLAFPMFSKAQNLKECGNPKIDRQALEKARIVRDNQRMLAPAPVLLRVYFTICRNSDGTNAGATQQQIANEFNRLVSDYRNSNICFANMGVKFVDDTQINTNLDSDVPANVAWLNPHLVPNSINIFYHANLPKYGGNAFRIPNTFCSIARDNIGFASTISHEVGHCLGLMHTHETATGTERINGNDCGTRGDEVCDTPADPYSFRGTSCFSNNGCLYTGTCKDPDGNSGYTPPYNNLMGYWEQLGCARNVFTTGQFTRVNSFLTSDDGLRKCTSDFNATVSNINVSSGFYLASAVNQLTANSAVTISGTTTASLAGAAVYLGPGFTARPAAGGFVQMRVTSCTFPAAVAVATTKPNTTRSPELEPEHGGARVLLAYPNPTSSEVRLAFTLKKNERSSLLQVYDVHGKMVKTMALVHLGAGKQTVLLSLTQLPSGIYYVYLQTDAERLSTKVVLIR